MPAAEERGEDFSPDLQYRICLFEHIKRYGAVVGVHNDLHGVSHVVGPVELGGNPGDEPARFAVRESDDLPRRKGLAIRKVVRGGIRVDDPVQLSIRHGNIGVMIQLQEGCDGSDTIPDLPVKQHSAFLPWIAGEEESGAVEFPAEYEFAPEVSQGHAAGSRMTAVDVLIPLRVIKLLLARSHVNRSVGQLTIVNLRTLRHELGTCSLGWNVLDQEIRQSIRCELAHGCHGDPITVGVLEPLIHEGLALRRQVRQLHFARRDHDLPIASANRVSIDIHILEFIVKADRS